jgi:cytochrome P450
MMWPFVKSAKDAGYEISLPNDPNDDGWWGQGEAWKKYRTFMNKDLLAPAAARRYRPGLLNAASLASKGAPASSADLVQYTTCCSFDLFCTVMFGQMIETADKGTPSDPEILSFMDNVVVLANLITPLTTAPFEVLVGTGLGIKTAAYNELDAAFASSRDTMEKIVDDFVAREARGELDEFEQNSYLAHALVRQKGPESDITMGEMKELCMMQLTAAVDTTSAVLNWCLIHIAMNSDVQEKLAEEIEREGIEADKLGAR